MRAGAFSRADTCFPERYTVLGIASQLTDIAMCENKDKAVHLKTLIAEIKVLIARWRKTREKWIPVVRESRD
jgi:hypothetical protein